MSNQLHNDLRKEFQLERLILFSDAVFAIAITLLAIEIKVPDFSGAEITDHNMINALRELIPRFAGFVFSFLLIGQYWIVHHRMFSFVINFSDRLVWLNILFLLGVALMPFSTAFYSEYVMHGVITPVIFYTANIGWLGLFNFFMWRHISNPKHGLSEGLTKDMSRYFSLRSLTVPIVFIFFSFVYIYKPFIAGFIPLLIPLILRFGFGPMKRRILAAKKRP